VCVCVCVCVYSLIVISHTHTHTHTQLVNNPQPSKPSRRCYLFDSVMALPEYIVHFNYIRNVCVCVCV